MEENILAWLFPAILVACVLVVSIGVGFTNIYFGAKHAGRIGQNGMVNDEDCAESADMLVSFIDDSLYTDGRSELKESVGCTGLSLLYDSKDVKSLVKKTHQLGGRLVLRKESNGDIERPENTVVEVQKKLEEMDIKRSKLIRRR